MKSIVIVFLDKNILRKVFAIVRNRVYKELIL